MKPKASTCACSPVTDRGPDGSSRARGALKIFLGYAAGVGKTYRMLREAQELKRQGRDIVIGYFEPHGRADTIAQIEGLEIVPRRRCSHRGHAFEEMDTDAILARRPEICAVDEFPHTNVPGSARGKRWEDVVVLLEAGIDVSTTMNIQHLESLNDQIREISGIEVRETVPDWIVKEADEVVLGWRTSSRSPRWPPCARWRCARPRTRSTFARTNRPARPGRAAPTPARGSSSM
jgi:K+-sensing histidine kinase KdpD